MRAKEPDKQGHIIRDGVRIAWERFGDRGPWGLFVPTWHIVHSRSWKMQVAYLSRRFRVLTLDPRGNGTRCCQRMCPPRLSTPPLSCPSPGRQNRASSA